MPIYSLHSTRKACCTGLLVMFSCSAFSAARADESDYLKSLTFNDQLTPPARIAFRNVVSLNSEMMSLFDKRMSLYQDHLLANHPVILALFSGDGGRFILYQPGKDAVEAPSPPSVYKLAKSVGHCAMITYELAAPYCNTSEKDHSWVGDMRAYRSRVQTALDTLDDLKDVKTEDRELFRDTLKNHVLPFLDQCLSKNSFTYSDLRAYTQGVKPDLLKLIDVSTSAQVTHWYKVLEEWKATLGKDWDKTYAVSNSIYVTRQNNILFTLLTQFFGEQTLNDRLLLLETTDFTASPDDMLGVLVRILTGRPEGLTFFNNSRLMDYELLGSSGRKAIELEARKRGNVPILPPLVPFNSHEWPMRNNPGSGTGPCTIEELK